MKHVLPVAMLLGMGMLSVTSCKKEISPQSVQLSSPAAAAKMGGTQMVNTFKGPEITMGRGKVRSFVRINHEGVPQEIGAEITADALDGLPMDQPEYSFDIPLHQKAGAVTPFDHMEVDWNPAGHPPPGIYTLPHFDVHFYMISEEEQMAIPPYTTQTAALFDNYPPDGYIPTGYIPAPEGVPQMGKHWLDVTSAEFNGGPFSKTFIFGSYDGRVIFYEPMVAKDFLESTSYSISPIRQPQYFSPTNTYYPTQYQVYKNDKGNYVVSLSGFEMK